MTDRRPDLNKRADKAYENSKAAAVGSPLGFILKNTTRE